MSEASLTPSEHKSSGEFYENPMDGPISVGDAASMLRVSIPKNCPPYQAKVLELNNAHVDTWEETVLKEFSTNGKLQASLVWDLWLLYADHVEIQNYEKNAMDLPLFTEDQARMWFEMFEHKTIEELYALGKTTLSHAWNIITAYIQRWSMEQKRKRIYVGQDVKEWKRNWNRNQGLITNQELPFSCREVFTDISQKISAILSIRVVPQLH